MNFYSVLRRARLLAGIGTLALAPLAGSGEAAARQPLYFDVAEGLNFNSFLRDGPVAAHLLLRSGTDPRILVAFPAGNSGVGLWFAHTTTPVTWTMFGRPQPLTVQDERGRSLYGITAEASVTGAAELSVKQAALSSVRVLRDYQALGSLPPQVSANQEIHDSTITWARDRLDGAAGYRLSLQVTEGTLRAGHITAGGSWRFNTYFGRDTLMSVRLLMPVLTPEAVAAGLGAVLTRLSPQGEVAHEEDIGEFAILDHLHATGDKSDAPTFNYNMIDGTFMLAPVAAEWLLDDPRGRTRAAELLARMDGRSGAAARALGADLTSNLRFVLQAARKFAQDPRSPNLIALKPGLTAGQWRDSGDGRRS